MLDRLAAVWLIPGNMGGGFEVGNCSTRHQEEACLCRRLSSPPRS
jgi:hypothetical protein